MSSHKAVTSNDVNEKQLYESAQCERCIWYLFALSDSQDVMYALADMHSQANETFSNCAIKVDTDQWSQTSDRFDKLSNALTAVANLSEAVDVVEQKRTLISLRLFYRNAVSRQKCRSMAVNPARHRCKICVDNYKDYRQCDRKTFKPFDQLQFGCASNAEIRANSQQTQAHMSNLSFQRQGDGTFFPHSSIVKQPDAPGQSLLKQAIREGRGESPTSIPDKRILRPPFETFTTEQGALVPPASAPITRRRLKRLHNIAAFTNNVQFNQSCRAADCVEDQFDVTQRQQSNWYDEHFSGKKTFQNYFIDTAERKGISKHAIVDALIE